MTSGESAHSTESPEKSESPENAGVDAKAALRRRIRASRRSRVERGDPESRRRDGAALSVAVVDLIERHVSALGSPDAGARRRVAAYRSMATEPPTDLLVESLVAAGYDVVVPVMLPDLDLDWADALEVAPPGGVAAGLEVTTLGVDALTSAAVIVTPGLAVDREGHRLGQGGGSYDRALTRRGPDALVVTLLYDEELLDADERVAAQQHDVRVDAVVTPGRGVVRLKRPQRGDRTE